MPGTTHRVTFTIFEYFSNWGSFQDKTLKLKLEEPAADDKKTENRNTQLVKLAVVDYSECFRTMLKHYRMLAVCDHLKSIARARLGTTEERTNMCMSMYDYVCVRV